MQHKTRIFAPLAALFLVVSGAQAAPKLTPTTPAHLKKVIAQGKGKPTVVNLWATWCSSCVAKLPTVAKIQKANKGRANVVLVSANELAPNAKVQQTLQKAGLSSSLISRADLTVFLKQIAPKAQPVLPITLIYDKRGRLVKTLSDEYTQAEFQRVLAPYLK